MLISYHWLKKFVNLTQSPKEVADKITLNLVEVESITTRGQDTILEIENKGITNRPDCFSQLGLAREVAAYFNLKLNDPLPRLASLKLPTINTKPLSIKVKEPFLCPRYSGLVLDNIKIKPSPKWLKSGVENCGIRSINNVVDITNYVMLEIGQPLHVFDYDQVENKQIIIRRAKNKEKIVTLDGIKRVLNENILIIADKKNPLALAGIMGGKKAEINSQTKTIILESANFEKINNRQTEKFLKLRTEASTRFEKGLDINLTTLALKRAVELLKKVAGVKVASPLIDKQFKKPPVKKIITNINWLNKFLGLKLTESKIKKILENLQLKPIFKNKKLVITVPSYRSDLKMPADIAEEIARIYGYDNIPQQPLLGLNFFPRENKPFNQRKKTKIFFQSIGFNEIISLPFLGQNLLKDFYLEEKKHLSLINPLNSEQKFLRQTLVPALSLAAKKNLKYFKNFKIFSIAKVFFPQGKKQPQEVLNLGAAIIGKNPYFRLKGAIELFLEYFNLHPQFKPLTSDFSFWQKNKTALICYNKQTIGLIGFIKPNSLNLPSNFSITELNFDLILKIGKEEKIYQPLLNYPPIIEDLTFALNKQIYVSDLIQLIKQQSSIIQSVKLIDIYKNSRTFRIIYQHPKKNLSNKEVAQIRKKIIFKVKAKGWGKLKEKE